MKYIKWYIRQFRCRKLASSLRFLAISLDTPKRWNRTVSLTLETKYSIADQRLFQTIHIYILFRKQNNRSISNKQNKFEPEYEVILKWEFIHFFENKYHKNNKNKQWFRLKIIFLLDVWISFKNLQYLGFWCWTLWADFRESKSYKMCRGWIMCSHLVVFRKTSVTVRLCKLVWNTNSKYYCEF